MAIFVNKTSAQFYMKSGTFSYFSMYLSDIWVNTTSQIQGLEIVKLWGNFRHSLVFMTAVRFDDI